MKEDWLVKKIYEARIRGKNKVCRPRIRWKEQGKQHKRDKFYEKKSEIQHKREWYGNGK